MPYQPPTKVLENYAALLVNFALNEGRGVQPGESVWLRVPKGAMIFYPYLENAVLAAGGHPLSFKLRSDSEDPNFYLKASDEQLAFFPDKLMRGLVDQVDHMIAILAPTDKSALKNVPPARIMRYSNSLKPYMEWRNAKEAEGRFSWTIGAYGTPAMAADADMSEEEYWQQIISACYLDQADPIAQWQKTMAELHRIRAELNALPIEKLHVEAEGIDLVVGVGPNRSWLGGTGQNIPSFELFISPDWRQTEGTISFNQPLYRYGNKIEDISLRFEKGRVVEATASHGEELLKEMIASENADKIGEFSLTDSRHSQITRPMGETLYDENIGGEQGNTHLALGNAYRDSYLGDVASITNEQWDAWGYNHSPVHTDIISTARRTVTATLSDGTERVIYQDGQFRL